MTKPITLDAEAITIKEETPLQITLRRFRKHRLAMIALVIISFIFLISIFAKQIAQYEVDELNVGSYFLDPGAVDADTGRTHIFGTDNIGRDYFSRLIYAGRISLTVALISVLISSLIGIVVGSISGFVGGALDSVLMRFTEFLITIPSLPLLLIISAMVISNEDLIPIPDVVLRLMGGIMLLTPRDTRQAVLIIMVLAGLGWTGTAQLMRGMVLSLREQTFVEASRSLGASSMRIRWGWQGMSSPKHPSASWVWVSKTRCQPGATCSRRRSSTCLTGHTCRSFLGCQFSCVRCVLTTLVMVCATRWTRA
jgi:peptide/nickel transport system permease protein